MNFAYFVACSYLALSLVGGVRFYVQPTLFYAEHTDVKLICANISHSTNSIQNVIRISIEKLGDDDTWSDVAVIQSGSNQTQIFSPNISATGQTGHVSSAHLIVNWPIATPDKFGQYLCEAIGYTANHQIQIDKSVTLDLRGIPENNASQLYEYISRSDRDLMRKAEESLTKTLQAQLDLMNEEFQTGNQYSFSKLVSDMNSKIGRTRSTVANMLNLQRKYVEATWPAGNFTLLMPDTGCPMNSAEWQAGNLQQKSPSLYNYYETYGGLHMAKPSCRKYFFYQNFCSLESSSSRRRGWPSGSYCINQHGDSCPKGFNSSQLKYDLDNSNYNSYFGTVPTGVYDTYKHQINYCCRHDSSPDKPITLPRFKPFYLYRYGETCQQVDRMDVIDDYFRMKTDADTSGDSWISGDVNSRPSIDIKPIRASLCYYSERRV